MFAITLLESLKDSRISTWSWILCLKTAVVGEILFKRSPWLLSLEACLLLPICGFLFSCFLVKLPS